MDNSLGKFSINPELLKKILQNNILLSFVILLFTLKIITALLFVNIPPNIFFADITKSALQVFVNQTRQSLGLNPLTENQKLNQAAQLKAQNMVQNQYFAHTSPSGITPWFWFLQAGYNYKYAGENLAIGFFESEEVYSAWLNSSSHKANILNPNYTEVGTAVVSGFGQEGAVVVVQEFGSPLPVKQATASKIPPVIKPTKPLPVSEVKPTRPLPVSEVKPTTTPSSTTYNVSQVLSQTTEFQNYITAPTGNSISNTYAKIMNFALYNFDKLVQNVIYGVSSIVIGILLALVLFNFKIHFDKKLVFRSLLIVILLTVASAFNKELILSIIPHQIII